MKQEREKYVKEKIIMDHKMLSLSSPQRSSVPSPHFRMEELRSIDVM